MPDAPPSARRRPPLGVLTAPLVWLERARGRWRLALAALYLLILTLLSAFAYRATRLHGLPDIGDPFDPRTVRASRVADAENAHVRFRRAFGKARRSDAIEDRLLGASYAWPQPGDVAGLAYVADNAEALEIWRRACDESRDAMIRPVDEIGLDTPLTEILDSRHFVRLALLMASGRRDAGDQEAAWGWYRAALRCSRLVQRNGPWICWQMGLVEYQMARNLIAGWAADPRVSASLLRSALDDVREINARTVPISDALRIEYLLLMREMADPEAFRGRFLERETRYRRIDVADWSNHLPGRWRLAWWLQNEPERARRLIRLTFANWLAHCDDPRESRPPKLGGKPPSPRLFDALISGGGPAPADLLARIATSAPAHSQLSDSGGPGDDLYDRDRAARAAVVLGLARELYAREHNGRAPESDEALVGPYLDRLP